MVLNADNERPEQRFQAKKRLGQHFLVDGNITRRIVQALEPGPEDRVLEIGPGQGALTTHLVEAGLGWLCALERDPELPWMLKARWPSLEIVHADALRFVWEKLPVGCKIVGNLPYNIASPLLWEIVSRCGTMDRAVVMVQKEVGQRLTATPGGKEYGSLSVWVQSFAQPKALFTVGPQVFRPRPKVDSMVLALRPLPTEERPREPEALNRLLRLCFQNRRKQLGSTLRSWRERGLGDFLESLAIAPSERPERLTPKQFQALASWCFGQIGA